MKSSDAIELPLRTLGAAVRSARQQRGWTQEALALRAGLSAPAVMKIEAGSPAAKIGQVLALCSVLGIAMDPAQHASTPAQERHLLELAGQRKRVRRRRIDPALDV